MRLWKFNYVFLNGGWWEVSGIECSRWQFRSWSNGGSLLLDADVDVSKAPQDNRAVSVSAPRLALLSFTLSSLKQSCYPGQRTPENQRSFPVARVNRPQSSLQCRRSSFIFTSNAIPIVGNWTAKVLDVFQRWCNKAFHSFCPFLSHLFFRLFPPDVVCCIVVYKQNYWSLKAPRTQKTLLPLEIPPYYTHLFSLPPNELENYVVSLKITANVVNGEINYATYNIRNSILRILVRCESNRTDRAASRLLAALLFNPGTVWRHRRHFLT